MMRVSSQGNRVLNIVNDVPRSRYSFCVSILVTRLRNIISGPWFVMVGGSSGEALGSRAGCHQKMLEPCNMCMHGNQERRMAGSHNTQRTGSSVPCRCTCKSDMPDLNSEQTFSNHDRDRDLDEAAAPETVTETNITFPLNADFAISITHGESERQTV